MQERADRLTKLTSASPIKADHGLLKVVSVASEDVQKMQSAINHFLWVCLTQHRPAQSFRLTDDMVRDYAKEVSSLPNITPNGLVLPKAENILAYNEVQQEVARAFGKAKLYDRIDRMQFPVNLRLQSGVPDAAIDSRPRASAKPHSDIWAGDPASGILVFLSILGSPECASIKFLEPTSFPVSFLRPLDDYLLGAPVTSKAKELPCRFAGGAWYLVDPFVIHQTIKQKEGFRLSIDFRFVPKDLVSSDNEEDEARKPYFLSTEEWTKLGKEKLILTPDTFASRGEQGASYTKGYPARLRVVDVETLAEVRYG